MNDYVHCVDGPDLRHNVKQVLQENLVHFIPGSDTPALLSLAERGRVDFSERLVLLEYFEPGIQHSGRMAQEHAGGEQIPRHLLNVSQPAGTDVTDRLVGTMHVVPSQPTNEIDYMFAGV